jgi:hypothetical protein
MHHVYTSPQPPQSQNTVAQRINIYFAALQKQIYLGVEGGGRVLSRKMLLFIMQMNSLLTYTHTAAALVVCALVWRITMSTSEILNANCQEDNLILLHYEAECFVLHEIKYII